MSNTVHPFWKCAWRGMWGILLLPPAVILLIIIFEPLICLLLPTGTPLPPP